MKKLFSTLGIGALLALLGAIFGCLLMTAIFGNEAYQAYQASAAQGTGWEAFDIFGKAIYVLVFSAIGAIGGAVVLGVPGLLISAIVNIFKRDKKQEMPHDETSQ